MCITSSNSILDNTYIGVWDINHVDYGYRHVLTYQNRVENTADESNCMLLHIPSKEPILPEWIVDTAEAVNFLSDLYSLVDPPVLSRGHWMGGSSEPENYIVEMGVYHIAILNVLTEAALSKALAQIPAKKRPHISEELINFFKSKFKGFPLLLCCFNNKEALKASPIMVHFPPLHSNKLMAPTIDAHGHIPDTDSKTTFHQKIIFGSSQKQEDFKLPYRGVKQLWNDDRENLLALRPFLPNYIGVFDFLYKSSKLPNKDVCIDLESVERMEEPKVTLDILGMKEEMLQAKVSTIGQTFVIRRVR